MTTCYRAVCLSAISLCLLLLASFSLVSFSLARSVHAASAAASGSFADVIAGVQPRIVKIYGAGGFRGLEAYQSGFLISAEGHLLTAWSYVLDTDMVTVVLHDGRRFTAELLGADPKLEIAILKIDARDLEHFSLDEPAELQPGDRVLAFSNLFGVAAGDEAASVLQGVVSANTDLAARRGVYQTPYRGPAYVLDAMTNNPGASGGALTNRRGELAGLLGKELRNAVDNTWLNYALPVSELRDSVDQILAGQFRPRDTRLTDRKPLEPLSLDLLGLVLVPDVLAKTPPYIDQVQPQSPAAKAGLQPDDLILFANDQMVRSARELKQTLSDVDRIDELRLIIQRGQQLIEASLFAPDF